MKYDPAKILNSKGPLLNRKLAQIMSEKHDVGVDLTRKGIERAYKKGKIKRIEFMTFGRREHLYYSSKTTNQVLVEKVLKTIEKRRPIVFRLWKALKKEKILPHRDGLKITGLRTKKIGKKESYKDVFNYLIQLKLAFSWRVLIGRYNIGFLVLNTKPPIKRRRLRAYAKEIISQRQIVESYLSRVKSMGVVKNVRTRRQIASRIFDAVGEAVSRRYMVVVFDFNLLRTTDDYVIEGLLDRVFSVYRKKFKQVVITYCISRKFTKAAQQRAMTGRFKQINLIRVEMEKGRLITKKIDGISIHSRGEFLENQIRYILQRSGFEDVQKGLKVYQGRNGLTERRTSKTFTDIDIITQSKTERKVIVCELKNWHREVPQKKIEDWVEDKLNAIVDYLGDQFAIGSDIIEAWYIVSKKQKSMDENEIKKKCKCKITIMTKRELIDDEIGKIDRFLANELKPIVLD